MPEEQWHPEEYFFYQSEKKKKRFYIRKIKSGEIDISKLRKLRFGELSMIFVNQELAENLCKEIAYRPVVVPLSILGEITDDKWHPEDHFTIEYHDSIKKTVVHVRKIRDGKTDVSKLRTIKYKPGHPYGETVFESIFIDEKYAKDFVEKMRLKLRESSRGLFPGNYHILPTVFYGEIAASEDL